MLKLYHHPLSPNSRKVWIALLEKGVAFELVQLAMDGDQFKPEFLAISPFHHIPVLVDDDFTLVESDAILDYLEVKHPAPALLPSEPRALGTMRMVQMVTVNELSPAMHPLLSRMMGMGEAHPEKLEQAKKQTAVVLHFFERLLTGQPYFGGEHLSLADIAAGVSLPWLPQMGLSLAEYPNLNAWCERLISRPSWQSTQPTPEMWDALKTRMQRRDQRSTD